MSISKHSRKDFLAIKKLPEDFQFLVDDWREMSTQYGDGIFLSGEVIQTPSEIKKNGVKKGLLRISPTTATSLEKMNLKEWDQLIQKVIHFSYNDDAGTILATDVTNWTGDSIIQKDAEEPTKKEV